MRAKTRLCCELALVIGMVSLAQVARAQNGPPLGFITKLGEEIDVRSDGRVLADELARSGGIVLPDVNSPVAGGSTVAQIHLRGGNVQANSTTEDYIQIFRLPAFRTCHAKRSLDGGLRPQHRGHLQRFDRPSPQSESERAGPDRGPRACCSGFATSNDGGQTWTADSCRPSPAAPVPSAIPRWASTATAPSSGGPGRTMPRATERLRSTAPAMADERGVPGSSSRRTMSRQGMAGGRPGSEGQESRQRLRDMDQLSGRRLRAALRPSIDGGVTFTAKTIFVPTAEPIPRSAELSPILNPVVDGNTGTPVRPFPALQQRRPGFHPDAHSGDAGETFSFATFNIPGAPARRSCRSPNR